MVFKHLLNRVCTTHKTEVGELNLTIDQALRLLAGNSIFLLKYLLFHNLCNIFSLPAFTPEVYCLLLQYLRSLPLHGTFAARNGTAVGPPVHRFPFFSIVLLVEGLSAARPGYLFLGRDLRLRFILTHHLRVLVE